MALKIIIKDKYGLGVNFLEMLKMWDFNFSLFFPIYQELSNQEFQNNIYFHSQILREIK